MQGFFYQMKKKPDMRLHKNTYKSGARSPRASVPTIPKDSKKTIEDPCEECGLYKKCNSPKMKVSGLGRKKILIIAEAPGKTEDEDGVQLVGEAGKLFRDCLKDIGLDLDEDFWKTNSIICRPANDRKPSRKELKLCRSNIEKTIKELKPEFVWLMGGSAVESFFMDRFSDLGINLWKNRLIPDYEHNSFIIPLYHPSYVLRNKDERLRSTFTNDLKWAISNLGKKLPTPVNLDDVHVLTSEEQIVSALKGILENKDTIVFDYETSALNSRLPNPKIWSVGVNGVSFGLDHPEVRYDIKRIERLWSMILLDDQIDKVAHNLKFENSWSNARFNCVVKSWLHDTMTTQHIVEYRTTSMGLKFQSFVRWGIPDYEKDTKKYLPYDGKTNKLDQMPLGDLCRYNAIDTVLTEKLWKYQRGIMAKDPSLKRANNLFFDGLLAFCDIEQEGICIDVNWYENRQKELTTEIDNIEAELVNGKEGVKFKRLKGRELKIASNKDLVDLFFDVMGLEVSKKTMSGNPSVDVESLLGMKLPFTEKLLRYRKLIKIRDTYLAQFLRENIGGKIHPSFLLHTVDTYRSSCVSPNFQNIPVREEEAKKETRSGIIPSKGNKLLEVDYKAMEVRICACYTKDPELIGYINDPTSDMHTDQAKILFKSTDKETSKDMRFYAKNGFVFPEIYGSYYKSCAESLWASAKGVTTKSGIPLLTHLKQQGIKNIDAFIIHVKEVEKKFFRKFSLIKEWKEANENWYSEHGYIQYLFGHKRGGYLSRNALANYPIQGAAFHCLLWSLIQLNRIRKKEKWKTKIVGQIHDSIIFDMDPQEQDHVL
jgi:uracil-DNA glycosylase family 4